MNSILLGLLLATCAFQVINADILDSLRIQVQQSRNKVDSIRNDLTRAKRDAENSGRNQISRQKSQILSNVNSFVNPALTQIRSDVDAAKAEGKDAEHCHTAAKDSLRSVSSTGFSEANKCENNAQQILNQALAPIDTLNALGQQYLNELNNIFPSCFSGNGFQMQNCIVMKLATVNSQLRTYESEASRAKNEGLSAANKANLSIMNCGFDVQNEVRIGTTNARIEATKCIKAL